MDYTKVPRSLIYRERRSFEEFGAYEEKSITGLFVDELLKFESDEYPDTEKNALWCLNNAYYICTMFFLEKDPRPRTRQYKIIATPKMSDTCISEKFGSATLSMVILLLQNLEEPLTEYQKETKTKLLTLITTDVSNEPTRIFNSFCKRIYVDKSKYKIISSSLYTPRIINKETVHDVMIEENFSWTRFTNYFEERSIRDIVASFGTTEEEKHNVVDILRQASHGFYAMGFNDRPEQVDRLLAEIDNEIHLQYISEHYPSKDKPAESSQVSEEDGLKAKIREQADALKQANKIIEEYRQPVKELTAKQKIRMEFAVQLLLKAGLTEENLHKENRKKSKVASLLSLLLDIGPTICANFLVDRDYHPQIQDENTILELDKLCLELGISAHLSTQQQLKAKA